MNGATDEPPRQQYSTHFAPTRPCKFAQYLVRSSILHLYDNADATYEYCVRNISSLRVQQSMAATVLLSRCASTIL